MTVVAGVDVGNATTEVVVASREGNALTPVAWERTMTRGSKGSPSSLDAAAALLRRLERQGAPRADVIALAPLRPVGTEAVVLPEPAADTGRLVVAGSGVQTAGGTGHGAGQPIMFGELSAATDTDVIVLVPADIGFREVALVVGRALANGVSIRGLVLASDEAVLVSNRLPTHFPVMDQVDVSALRTCRRVLVEVRPSGQPVRALSDALHLSSTLGLGAADAADVTAVCRSLFDVSNGAVGVLDQPLAASSSPADSGMGSTWVEFDDGRRRPIATAHPLIAAGPPGLARRVGLPTASGERVLDVDDLGTVHLGEVADVVISRSGSTVSRSYALSALHRGAVIQAADQLAATTGLPVVTVDSEAVASRRGALTTPGATSVSAVVDLGGGTVDVTTNLGEAVVAGAGDLLTVSTAAVLGLPKGAAEWVKRVPCHRVESPHLLVGEDGSRTFVDTRLPGDHVGSLVVPGPAGWLAFDRSLAAAEWRALRLALKREVLGGAVRRALRSGDRLPDTVVLVGGPAGDDEAVATVSRVLPEGTVVGRGDVAGVLGHRYAVAYGLAMGATETRQI